MSKLYCAGCYECIKSSAMTGEECVKIRTCKCHRTRTFVDDLVDNLPKKYNLMLDNENYEDLEDSFREVAKAVAEHLTLEKLDKDFKHTLKDIDPIRAEEFRWGWNRAVKVLNELKKKIV